MKTLPVLISITTAVAVLMASAIAPEADTFRPVVRGKRGVVTAGHPLSAEAGLRLLQQGGNATDAGCATILAASVIEFSHFSFGGEVPIIIKPGAGSPVVITGQGQAPRLANRKFFLDRAQKGEQASEFVYRGAPEYVSISAGGARPGTIPSSGILPATVPAVLDAVIVALDRFGTKTLAEVMQPAIELADGFPIDELRVTYIKNTRKIFEAWPTSAKLFLPGGREPKRGRDLFPAGPCAHAQTDSRSRAAVAQSRSEPGAKGGARLFL